MPTSLRHVRGWAGTVRAAATVRGVECREHRAFGGGMRAPVFEGSAKFRIPAFRGMPNRTTVYCTHAQVHGVSGHFAGRRERRPAAAECRCLGVRRNTGMPACPVFHTPGHGAGQAGTSPRLRGRAWRLEPRGCLGVALARNRRGVQDVIESIANQR